ncbi:MAG: putative lipid II flippase FtsW [Planctomycetaceae bacterium]
MAQDRGLFIALASALVGFGILMVHSASITSWPTEFEQVYLSRHAAFLVLGISAAVVCAFLPADFWFRVSPWIFGATIVLLLLVLIPGVGTRVNGAQRWFRYGGLSLQPSELTKIALPLFMARQLCLRRTELHKWIAGTVPVVAPLMVTVPLVLLEPDLGTSLFLTMGGAIALFVGGWPLRNFVLGAMLFVPPLGLLVATHPYQVQRITGFVATWTDWSAAPYQLQQSLISLGAGGMTGVGLGKGWQKLSFLPEANTDFVFAVVGEELGLVGTLSLVGLWAGLFVAGVRLLSPLRRDSFEAIAGFTLLTQLTLQAFLNMAVVTALVPPKGIPHPLVSYGGSNLVVSVIALGIILGLARSSISALREPVLRQPPRLNAAATVLEPAVAAE